MSDYSSSSKMPVAPVVFDRDLPPLADQYSESESEFRRTQYDRLRYNQKHFDGSLADRWDFNPPAIPETPTSHAAEMELDAHCRAINGGLPDAPADGGPRAVGSKPFNF